jgi:hypothetical protein
VVLDNLKEGVLVPDLYDPTVNPLFRDVLAHYGVVALPCRIQDPDRKGKMESGIGHTKKTQLYTGLLCTTGWGGSTLPPPEWSSLFLARVATKRR